MRRHVFFVVVALCGVGALIPQAVHAAIRLGSANTATLTRGLVFYLPLDGAVTDWNTNTTADLSGNGNTGSLTSMSITSSPVAGKVGQAIHFDGGGGYVTAPDSPSLDFSGNYSMFAWIRPTGLIGSQWATVFSKGDPEDGDHAGYALRFTDTGVLFPEFGNGLGPCLHFGSQPIVQDKWQHVGYTWDGSLFTVYINGVAESSGTSGCGGTMTPGTAALTMGQQTVGDTGFNYQGDVDDARIYNRALSPAEIKQLYGTGTANAAHANNVSVSNGLVGYWPLDGSVTNWTTNQTTDASGRGNTGSLISFSTSTSPVAGKLGQALTFDGSDDYIALPYSVTDALAGGTEVTLATWFKGSFIQSAIRLQTTGSDYILLGWDGTPPVVGVSNDGGVSDPLSINGVQDNKWHHIVMTWKANTVNGFRVYVDGILSSERDSNNSTLPTFDHTYQPMLGRYAGGGEFTDGTMDDVRIYSRALSATEVKQLYSSGAANVGHANTVSVGNGLIGYWPFDGSVTNWATGKTGDLSGQGHTGSLILMSTTTSPVAGKMGQALNFDGSSGYIDTANFADNPTNLTVTAWIKPEFSAGANIVVVGKTGSAFANGWSFFSQGTNSRVNFLVQDGSGSNYIQYNGPSLTYGTWHYIVGVIDGGFAVGQVHYYIDGVPVSSVDTAGTITDVSNSYDVTIGRGGTDFGGYYAGAIDDVRVYNRALSPSELKQLYDMGR